MGKRCVDVQLRRMKEQTQVPILKLKMDQELSRRKGDGGGKTILWRDRIVYRGGKFLDLCSSLCFCPLFHS